MQGHASEAFGSRQVIRRLHRLHATCPFITLRTIGYSLAGTPLLEARIGQGKTVVHANAGFHAHEWITSYALLDFLERYAMQMNTIKETPWNKAYETYTLSVVPIVNPDGVDLIRFGPCVFPDYKDILGELNHFRTDYSGWKANLRGVDLNNQFPAGWEIEQKRKPLAPAPRDFPGYAPLSEPEAQAMHLLACESSFATVLAFHTQGEVIYWGYQEAEPTEAKEMVERMQTFSGYRPVRTIDSHAGYKDWFIDTYRKPGFTIELGKGINPLPFSMYQGVFNSLTHIMASVML
ncbi:M14 family metallopeptidase [Aureibacillus halotolerans]|uniref:G-D-glutamyl-meso-diaminopimelate peptidase n=1 Tax=Aureibacillus halotolerans TaxID=1508390 RepID=A0A4R6U5D9_9BACI|nr:M14 family metallocarboxypeptidase [Aureibacillus halotolerans]TDQ41690.1 g-D-glutamyl-meso-diaminopimelate peptidase [Aureibacillus halotolerans]